MPPSSFRLAIFFSLSLFFLSGLFAQNGVDVYRYDAQIARFLKTGNRDSFLFFTDEKAKLARAAKDLKLWAWVRLEASDFLYEKGDYAAWGRHLEETWAEHWREPANAEEWEPFCYIQANRGQFLLDNGKFLQAARAFEYAAQGYEQYRYEDFDVVETIYKPLGNCYTYLGDNDKSTAVFQKALEKGGDNETMAGLHSNIALAYWNKGDLVASERSCRQGLNLPRISNAKRALLLGTLARIQLDKGEAEQAFRTASESLRYLHPASKDPEIIEYRSYSRRTAGEAASRTGRWAEAERLFSGALNDASSVFGSNSRDIGKVEVARSHLFRVQNKPLPALEAANRALAAILPQFRPQRVEDNPEGKNFYEENTIFEALAAKAAAAEKMHQQSGELRWLELALECHDLAWQAESLLRRVFQYSSSKLFLQKDARVREETAMHIARMLFEKTTQDTWLEKAFIIAERSKAALLLESLQDNLVRQRLAGSDPRFGQINALRQSLSFFEKNQLLDPSSDKISQWRTEADVLHSKIDSLQRAIFSSYPTLSDLETGSAKLSVPFGDLADGEALVEYFVSENFVDIFVFHIDEPATWQRIPHDAALQELAKRFLAYFKSADPIIADPAGYLRTAHALWQKILPPDAARVARLLILPDGFLNFIPFEALVTSFSEGSSSLRDASYLIRHQQVRYAWSLAVLRQQNLLRSTALKQLLGLAPGFSNRERGLAPLVDAGSEWKGSDRWEVNELLGNNADMPRFLSEAGQHRILHFSTHAFADVNPRIELFDAPLLLPDIYALPLQADLVVLSACETGLGMEQKGEGVMSLARAFAQAGAACIVSSLWSVNDHSTTDLLRHFYRELGHKNTVSASLHAAELAYLKDSKAEPSPYYWAGLIAVGDERKVKGNRSGGRWLWAGGIVVLGVAGWWLFRRKRRLAAKKKSL